MKSAVKDAEGIWELMMAKEGKTVYLEVHRILMQFREEKLEEAKNLLSLITNAKYTEEEKIKIVRELLYSGRGIGFSYPKPFRIELQEQLMSLVCQLPFGHRSSRLFTLRYTILVTPIPLI